MTTRALSFLIGSSSFLQVTTIDIRSQMSSKFGKIRIGTAEVAAIERLENSHRLIMGEML